MRLLKQNTLLRLVNSYMVDSPQPSNLSYAWNFGSLLAVCLGLQIVTGVFLAMHYNPSVDIAFVSVEHIMRDVNHGWLLRYLHANGASFFFITVYAHIGRGLYYSSYKQPRIMPWTVGVIMLVLIMAIAFLGFVAHSPKWGNSDNLNISSFLAFSIIPLASSSYSPQLNSIINQHNLNPFAVFEGLNNLNIKHLISQRLKGLAGVYAVINLVNGNIYVGSAVTGNLYTRYHKHLYSFTGSTIVAAAVAKHGLSSFAFVVLEVIPGPITTKNNTQLLAMENHYMALLRPAYNLAPNAGNTLGYKHSNITKQNMRETYSSERREATGALNRGKKFSDEIRTNFSKIALQRPPISADTRAKVSANSAQALLYYVERLDGSEPNTLRTTQAVADYCGCSVRTVGRAVQSNGIIRKTWCVTVLGKANKR